MYQYLLPILAMSLPVPNAGETESLFSWTNDIRVRHGLKAATLSDVLAKAASHHAVWMSKNNFSHYQDPESADFLGKTADDRARALGFRGPGVWEDISYWQTYNVPFTPINSLEQLFGVPYHRKLFLAPGDMEIGFGLSHEVKGKSARGHLAVNAAPAKPSGVVLSPFNGQEDVPLDMPGEETPDPLRLHPKRDVGYPIMVIVYGAGEMVLESARLTTDDGKTVPIFENHSGNDTHMKEGVILFSQDPLKPGTKYRAEVKGKMENGWLVQRDWTFTTRSK